MPFKKTVTQARVTGGQRVDFVGGSMIKGAKVTIETSTKGKGATRAQRKSTTLIPKTKEPSFLARKLWH